MDFDGLEKQPRVQRKPVPPTRPSAPVRPVVEQKPAVQPIRRPQQITQPKKQTSLYPALTRFKKVSKKTRIVASASLAVIILAVIVIAVLQPKGERPNYDTVLPAGKSISSLGGWRRVSPPDASPVFAFLDAIEGTTINVSQQPLPESFQANPSQALQEMAKAFNATDKIGNTGAFIGTSAKGPQSVLFIKGKTLVLIKSQKNISQQNWEKYINSLK
ncbi:hypothetical protein KI440_00365 [Candidatus Saccharibacteria bacterium TM7i]|nr:hypothetical protein KI440_00365 [Candidatus Saccharibacteria bacterium TM7i]